jgi:RHS repeat-associated protein
MKPVRTSERGHHLAKTDGGTPKPYLCDGLGSVLGEVGPLGNLTASRKYDVYGLVRAGDNGTSRHKFVGSLGHTSEDETGLIYMRARWMDPSLGRFVSEDPARDGSNWLECSRGNPVNAVDPDGRVWSAPILLLGLLAVICIGLAITTGSFWLLAIGCALIILDVVLRLWQMQSDVAPKVRELKGRQIREAGDESACLRALYAATAMKRTSGGGSWLMKVGAVFVEQLAWLGLSE